MSNQLQTNLDAILQDKNTNLKPENLKAGITCLGVKGTLEGETPVVKTVTCYETDACMSDKTNSNSVAGYQSTLTVGGSNNWDYRTYIKYDLSSIQDVPDIEIMSAKLYFNVVTGGDNYRDGSGYIFRCTNDWNSSTLTWNNQPTLQSYIDDIETPSYDPDVDLPHEYVLNITSIMKKWIDEKYANYGICFKGTEGGAYRRNHAIATVKYKEGVYKSYIEVQYKTTVSDITLQEKSVDIIDNGTTEVVPDSDYYGLSKVNINTNVPTGIDTSDANATTNDIATGKTAYVNGEKVTGTLPLFPNSRTFTVDGGVTNDTENNRIQIHTINTTKQILDSNLNMEFNGEYADVADAIGLIADKIKAGETILGITGTYEGSGSSSDFNQYGNMMVYNEGWSEYYFLTKNTYLRQVRCTDAVKADGGQAVCNLNQVDIVVSNNSAYVSGLFNSTDVINSQTLYLKLMNNDTVIYSTPIEVPEISSDNTYKDIILSDIKISTGIMESTEDINNRLLTCTNAIFTSVQ